jgi:hypothetical protein
VNKSDPYSREGYDREHESLLHCATASDRNRFPQDLKSEVELLFRHFGSSRFMSQFLFCEDAQCPLPQCGPRRAEYKTDVDRFFDKFGGRFPTPIPQFADLVQNTTPNRRSSTINVHMSSDVPEFDQGPGFHFQNFADLLRMDVPAKLFKTDAFYREEGAAVTGTFCEVCPNRVYLPSAVSARRHQFLAHNIVCDVRKRTAKR